MSASYDRGQRTPAGPFPLFTCLGVVAVIVAAGLAAAWYVTGQETTEIQNAAPVTRTITAPKP